MYYVYLLRCSDGTLYCGYTDDPERRLRAHNSGKGAKYTMRRLPVALVYTEAFADKSSALRRECAVKKLTRAEKLRLIAENPSAWSGGGKESARMRPGQTEDRE